MHMHILLVEDEELLAEYLKRSLAKAGHEVDYAPDGQIAYDKVTAKSYDVVILDIILPKKNGLDVCREARQKGVKTPIIILSSQDAEVARVAGLDVGADDYMIKPFSYPELEARLRALFRRPKEILSDRIEVGPIAYSATQHKVWKNNKEVELRSKEFALLEFLIRNPGRALTREELFDSVWGVSAENASNRVDVCVKEIRIKLGKDIIKTVHGVGYALNER